MDISPDNANPSPSQSQSISTSTTKTQPTTIAVHSSSSITSDSNINSIDQLRRQAQAHLIEIETENTVSELDRQKRHAEAQKYIKPPRKPRSKAAYHHDQPTTAAARTSPALAQRQRSESGSTSPPRFGADVDPTPSATDHASFPATQRAKLRPASDILSRLQHDPSYALGDYVIGYVERFDGIAELRADRWMALRDSTDEDFIPMHRVRWIVKRRLQSGRGGEKDGTGAGTETEKKEVEEEDELVWDRDRRIDHLFGSGVGGGGC